MMAMAGNAVTVTAAAADGWSTQAIFPALLGIFRAGGRRTKEANPKRANWWR